MVIRRIAELCWISGIEGLLDLSTYSNCNHACLGGWLLMLILELTKHAAESPHKIIPGG